MTRKTIDSVNVADARVLMRVDFNVPLDASGAITDDRRIRLALPSIRSVIDRGGRLILMSHLGRPAGTGPEPKYSLRPAADRLRELLGSVTVEFPGDDCIGAAAAAAVQAMAPGTIVVLENLRFHAEEKKGGSAFAGALAAYGDVYCNDAFGTAHRDDASMVAVPEAMVGKPRVSGLLLARELNFLDGALSNPAHPFVAVLGGAKVSDKLGAVHNLLGRVDTILVGGAMVYTFLKVLGRKVGASLVQNDMRGEAQKIIDEAAANATDLILAEDHVCGKALAHVTPVEVFETNIPGDWMGLDIGPKTTGQFNGILRHAKTIVWNGPMGAFETKPFDVGTRQVAEAIASATRHGATTVVGGGDTAAAVEQFGFADQFSHVSTGGGASLELLEGRRFRSVDLLD
ncbi:MAG: phosphoglycerate kinase [Phycisphaerales bacterium]|nr:phosphoglycerate kinase [Phycisphaerales bacterium]